MPTISDLFQGVVVETKAKSLMGPLFYSDKSYEESFDCYGNTFISQPWLNDLAKYPVIGIAAGVMRMALAIIHSIGHLLAALITFDKGHCFHAAKGGCEFLRGLIEAIPLVGRAFANFYSRYGNWWILKIYNPNAPDSLDHHLNLWDSIKHNRPSGYVTA
jgi:hypothetical protein